MKIQEALVARVFELCEERNVTINGLATSAGSSSNFKKHNLREKQKPGSCNHKNSL